MGISVHSVPRNGGRVVGRPVVGEEHHRHREVGADAEEDGAETVHAHHENDPATLIRDRGQRGHDRPASQEVELADVVRRTGSADRHGRHLDHQRRGKYG